MRCPNCQTLNPPNAKFCLECGYRLLVCPNCGTVNPPAAKFCIECGLPLPSITERVRNAGTPSTRDTQTDTQEIKEANTNNRINQASTSSETILDSRPANDTASLPTIRQDERQYPALGATNRASTTDNKRAATAFDGNKSSIDRLTTPEERRVVTIMFADITGSTPLADRLDPEDMRAILTGYFNLMTEQIRRHGGTVEKYIGDAVMAIFGAPVAHEDDPDRGIRAALDMQAALNRFNTRRLEHDPSATRLQMRIGINTGDVAAPGAQFRRQDFLITGDAVNVASRLQQAASPDTILVGERTYLSTRNVFDFRPIAPLQLKGKHEPVHAWVVQGLKGGREVSPAIAQHPRGIEGLQSPLVGRQLELTLMHTTYARVQAEQRPHLITLLGAPGIGKSRLVREFILREEEAAKSASSAHGRDKAGPHPRVLQGRCPPYGEGITYWPLIEILRSLLHVREGERREALEERLVQFVLETLTAAQSSEDAEQVAHALIRSIGSGFSDGGSAQYMGDRREIQRSTYSKSTEQGGPQVALMRAWRVFLEAIAEQGPLILEIDDLQWADEALLDLLEYLTDRISQAPILFICPARPDLFERRREWGGGRRNFTTIVLESLSREESGELITGLLNTQELPDVLYHTIQSRAEGNPFFVEEIVRMLIDQGVLVKQDGCWRPSEQNEAVLSELASPATPPEDTLIDQHYVLPLPRLPDTVQGVLAARVDLLSQVEKQVLQDAAIIGRTFWLGGLVELAAGIDRETLNTTIEALIQREFIIETEKSLRSPIAHDRVFSFKHILIRDVVYNNIPRTRRSQKHTQLALWIEATVGDNVEQFAELLAYHYKQALATWSAGLLAHSVKVGARFTSSEEANEESAIRLNPTRITRQELIRRTITYLTMAADQAFRGYYTIRAIQAYTEALDLLIENDADNLTIARMHQKLGDAYAQRANADEAWHEYSHALQLMQQGPLVHKKDLLCLYTRLAELSTRWLGWFNKRPDIQEIRSYIDAGLALLAGQPPNGDRAAFLTYQAMGYIRQLKGAIPDERIKIAEESLDRINEALRIAEAVEDTGALWLTLDALGFIYQKQRKFLEQHKAQHRRQEIASQISGREELYDLYISLGWAHFNISDYPTAAMWFGRAWRIAQTMESPSMLLYSMVGRMYVWYEWNRWDEVREVAYSILQLAEQYQLDDEWTLDALETLADISYRRGNIEESDSLVRQYRRLAEQRGIEPEPSRSIFLAREEWERACADFITALQRSEPFPKPSVVALLAELAVMTGKDADIQQEYCERAVTLAEQSGARKFLAIALRARGRMYLEQERWEAAEDNLKQALSQCELLDIPWERGQTLYCLGLYYRRHADVVNRTDFEERADARAADLGLAHSYFEQALGFFESLKAEHDGERARLALTQDSKAPV